LKEFGRTVNTQPGGIYLLGSSIRRYADDDVCVIVLSDSDNADAGRISRDLAAIVFAKHYDLPVEHHAINLKPTNYDSYVGRYKLASDFVLVVSAEANRLMLQGPRQPKIEILPESETRFFAKGLDTTIYFVKGPQGNATQLVLQQGGRDIPAPRTK
jgi:D-alanyl-D-alanine-carboxypeptidase/D-alanyl-D-alanine-endopeptidase